MSLNTFNNTIGQPFVELITVDSTNNYAMQLVQKGEAAHGLAVMAQLQTAGKGQRGKQWHAVAGQNITLSVVLNTNELPVSRQFALSAAVALAARELFTLNSKSETCVKWPNDIYVNDRKAGGILIENVLRGNNWQWAIAGIGLNINQDQFGPAAGRAISLRQVTGKTYDIKTLALALCESIGKRFAQVFTQPGQLLAEYNEVLFGRGKTLRLKKGSIAFNAVINKVTADGTLHVSGAPWDTFTFGEVEWVF